MADMEYIDRETIAKKCAIIIHIMKENHLLKQFVYCLQHCGDKVITHPSRNLNEYIDNSKKVNDIYLHDKQLSLVVMLCHSYLSFVFSMDKSHYWHKIMVNSAKNIDHILNRLKSLINCFHFNFNIFSIYIFDYFKY